MIILVTRVHLKYFDVCVPVKLFILRLNLLLFLSYLHAKQTRLLLHYGTSSSSLIKPALTVIFLYFFVIILSHSTRLQSLQVDSVQRWMEDLRHMTEVECMCVLQAKPIGVEDDSQHGELIVAQGTGDHVARNNLQTLLRRALVVSTELGKMFQRLEKGRWQRVHSTAVRANCHVRSLVHEYSIARSTPPEMQKVMVDSIFNHVLRLPDIPIKI